MSPNVQIKEIDPKDQQEARELIYRNCPVENGELTSYFQDAQKISTYKQFFPHQADQAPEFHTIVLGAYINNQLVGALNMNSFLYVLDTSLSNPSTFDELNTVMNMIWHAANTGIYIDNIGVDEKFRGAGIGTALIEYALGIAEFDYSVKYVGLAATSEEAKTFFQTRGFKEQFQGLPAEVFGGIMGLQLSPEYRADGMAYMLQKI